LSLEVILVVKVCVPPYGDIDGAEEGGVVGVDGAEEGGVVGVDGAEEGSVVGLMVKRKEVLSGPMMIEWASRSELKF